MAKFIVSGTKNPCPVCDRNKDGDCRIMEAENVILCHTYQDKTAPINGYEYLRKSDKGAGWGVWVSEKPKKAERTNRSQKQEFIYRDRSGQPLVKVTRQDRNFYQSRYEDGQWENGLTPEVKAQLPIYRYQEVKAAIAKGEQVWFVEGETCADALWRIGIPATTTIGGCKGYRTYGSYKQDLEGAQLVICPDRDKDGLEYADEVFKDFPAASWCRVYPKSPIWQRIPDHGGLDIADWIADGTNASQIKAAVSKTLFPEPVSILESTDWDEFVNLVSLLLHAVENPIEQEFRLRKLCQQYGMPLTFGKQVQQMVSGAIVPFEPMWVEEFLEQNTEDRQWVIASHVPQGTVMDLCAAGGLGKTTIVYNWCKHVILGEEWNNYRVKKGKVLIVQDDEPETDTREKLDIAKFYELPPRQCAITFKWQFSEIEQLVRFIDKEEILLCVIDSLGSTNTGLDRDKPEFANNLKLLRDVANQKGCTFLVLDHTNKGGSQLGTVAVRNTVSELVYMMAPSEDERRIYELGHNHRILWYDKSRAGLGGTKFVLEQQPLDYSWTHHGLLENIGNGSANSDVLELQSLLSSQTDQRFTVSQIRNHMGLDYAAAELLVEQLRRTGMIDSEWCVHGRDRYRTYYLKPENVPAILRQTQNVKFATTEWEEF